jgi:hypothetical protein
MDAKYDGFKVTCETSTLALMANKLNFSRRGTPVECLRKGFARGARHVFVSGDNGDEDLSLEQKQNLNLWGGLEAPMQIAEVDGIRDTIRLLPSREKPGEQIIFTSKRSPSLEFAVLQEDGEFLSDQVFDVLEDYQTGHPQDTEAPNTTALFLGPRRSFTARRHVQESKQDNPSIERRVWMLEDSFPAQETNSVFDAEDLERILQLSDVDGVLLLAVPIITQHLAPVPGQWMLCEVNFQTREISRGIRGKHIIFYIDLSIDPDTLWPNLQWYTRCLRQQFIFPGEEAFVETFVLDTKRTTIEHCAWLAILRLTGARIDDSRNIPQREQTQRVISTLRFMDGRV